MTNIKEFQQSAIISVTAQDIPIRDYQHAAIFSLTDIPNARVYQQCVIFSVTPPPRYIYGAQKVVTRSPQNLMVDMFANSRS